MDQKLKGWSPLRLEKRPPSGWLKAIRGALGITTRQLAQIIGVDSSAIVRLESREPHGKVTLEMLDRAAQAMDCKLIYAIVPKEEFGSLADIVRKRSRNAATEILKKVEHSMRLESQGSDSGDREIEELALSLEGERDPRVWGLFKQKKSSKG